MSSLDDVYSPISDKGYRIEGSRVVCQVCSVAFSSDTIYDMLHTDGAVSCVLNKSNCPMATYVNSVIGAIGFP